jgi:hypothetical protein
MLCCSREPEKGFLTWKFRGSTIDRDFIEMFCCHSGIVYNLGFSYFNDRLRLDYFIKASLVEDRIPWKRYSEPAFEFYLRRGCRRLYLRWFERASESAFAFGSILRPMLLSPSVSLSCLLSFKVLTIPLFPGVRGIFFGIKYY